jgi:hypothetical protein
VELVLVTRGLWTPLER